MSVEFIFEQIRVGGDRNFAYLVGDRSARAAAAIDPAFQPADVLARAQAQGLAVEHILNTHGHQDHVNGNAWLAEQTDAPIGAYPGLQDGDVVAVGTLRLDVLHVPGHAEDHLLFWLRDQKVAITGDLLFVGKIGGTATEEAARAEYDSLQRVLSLLPDDTTIWPGHDYGCRPASTLALEKSMNPFLLARDFDQFLQLKRDWSQYKARLGLK